MGIETHMPEEDKQPGQYAFTPPPTTPPGVTLPPTTPPPTTPPPTTPPPTTEATTDWRALRQQERAERRAERHADHGYNWIGGIVLILLGSIFLLQNAGLIESFDNWWALFILIPAVGSFAAAWRIYQQSGNQWTSAATGSLISGLVLCSIVAIFLFGLDIGMWWPLFLILGGIAALLGRTRGSRQ